MATTYKVLAQAGTGANNFYGNGTEQIAAANTIYNLYTVPASTQTVISTIVVANRSASAQTFRIAIRPASQYNVDYTSHYLAYDATVGANDSTTLTLGITMGAADLIKVYTSSTSVGFQAYGSEIA